MPRILQWTPAGRVLVFVLAAASIWCLLAEMYQLASMRAFFYAILLPATALLYGLAVLDRLAGDRCLWRAVLVGTLAGLCGAVVYDLFRLPFIYADAWGLGAWGIPQMPLFKVFPRFGALILGQPREQPAYSAAAHLLGWLYHFSNGATFGVMFAALYAGPRAIPGTQPTGSWATVGWATLMAVGIEACLLLSPYAGFFNIHLTTRFVVVTLLAHVLFGASMGVYFAWHTRCWRTAPTRQAAA